MAISAVEDNYKWQEIFLWSFPLLGIALGMENGSRIWLWTVWTYGELPPDQKVLSLLIMDLPRLDSNNIYTWSPTSGPLSTLPELYNYSL